MTADGVLLRRLRRMWQQLDPEPEDLVDRALVALALEDLDFELLTLQVGADLAVARSTGEDLAQTITFASSDLSVVVTISSTEDGVRRLDGWVLPPVAMQVELRAEGKSRHVDADDSGRFAFSDLTPTLVQIVLHPTVGEEQKPSRPMATPAFTI